MKKKKLSICLNSGPWQKLGFLAYAQALKKNFKVRMTNLQTYQFDNEYLASGGGSPLYPGILQYITVIPQRIRIIAVDAGSEPGTSTTEVWRAGNEPPHLLYNEYLHHWASWSLQRIK